MTENCFYTQQKVDLQNKSAIKTNFRGSLHMNEKQNRVKSKSTYKVKK